jgi:hypothetical protein
VGILFELSDGPPCDFNDYVDALDYVLTGDESPPSCKKDGRPTWLIKGETDRASALEYMGKTVPFINCPDEHGPRTHFRYYNSRWDTDDYTVPARLFYYELPMFVEYMELIEIVKHDLREVASS